MSDTCRCLTLTHSLNSIHSFSQTITSVGVSVSTSYLVFVSKYVLLSVKIHYRKLANQCAHASLKTFFV